MNTGKPTLATLAEQLSAGQVRIIDLTHTLSPDFPALQLPAHFGQVQSFKI